MVTKPDRLARSTAELLTTEADLAKRSIGLVILKGSLQRQMPIAPDYYPPFEPSELPASPSPRMVKALTLLYRASVEVHRNLYRLTLLNEISRNPVFVRQVNNTPAAYPMLTVRGSLTYAVAISLAAVFDLDDKSASLRGVLKTFSDAREEPALRQLHLNTDIDADLAIARVRRLHKRLNGGEVQDAVGRLKKLRDQHLAHYDINPQLEQALITPREIDRLFTFAANVVNTATVVGVKRLLQTRESYEDAQQQARDFAAAFVHGRFDVNSRHPIG